MTDEEYARAQMERPTEDESEMNKIEHRGIGDSHNTHYRYNPDRHYAKYEPVEVEKEYMKEASNGSPIINMVPDGGRDGGSGLEGALAGVLPLALLAPLFRGGFGGNENGGGRNIEAVIAEQIGDLRHDIGENAISTLKQAFEADKDALKAGFEAKIGTLEAVNKIDNKISQMEESTQNKFFQLEKTVDNKFSELSHQVEKGFAKVTEDELKRENSVLRERLEHSDRDGQTRAIVSEILTAIGLPTPILASAKK